MDHPVDILEKGPFHCVINKPPGQLVVQARGETNLTALEQIRLALGKNLCAVHRLDRVTSGCLVFARGQFAQQALGNAFKRHLIDKRYLAIVEGPVGFQKHDLSAPLKRIDGTSKKGPAAWQTVDPDGQKARTRFRTLLSTPEFSVVEAFPHTGRMHQIRIHLAHLGHPIVGDELYGAQSPFAPNQIGLHAHGISIPLPKGGRTFVHAPPPDNWFAFAKQHNINLPELIQDCVQRFKAKPKPSVQKPRASKTANQKKSALRSSSPRRKAKNANRNHRQKRS